MLKLIGIFSAVCFFSELMQRIYINIATFKIPVLHLIKKISEHFNILNAFVHYHIHKLLKMVQFSGSPCNSCRYRGSAFTLCCG